VAKGAVVVPTFLQAAGFACLVLAVTLLTRPRVRPSPATYAWAITVDALCILFTLGVLIVWPVWWLVIPLALWSAAMAVHILRLRDARVMVKVLKATHPPLGGPRRRTHNQESLYDYDGWPFDDQRDRYRGGR